MTSTGGPIRASGPNGTNASIMTKKTPKLGRIDQIRQVRIIILTVPSFENFILESLQLMDLHVMKPSNNISLYFFYLVSIDDDPSFQIQLFFVAILDGWLLYNFDSMCCDF